MTDPVEEGSDAPAPDAPAAVNARQAVVKDGTAFRTISELAAELGVPQHILRYWETRFPQLRPLQRAGNRRYYRPADVALAKRIHDLLENEHYTIKGVQRLLAGKSAEAEAAPARPAPAAPASSSPAPMMFTAPMPQNQHAGVPLDALRRVRSLLAQALAADAA